MGGIGPTGSIGGSEQQYALKWNDFHSSILNSFRHLRDEADFIDVTIACDGSSFTAHKVVLSACSPYFRSLLKANPCQHPIIILQDVREQDMEALIRFMYHGEVHIGQDQLPDFLRTAQTLQVRGLAEVSPKDQHKLSNISSSIPWSSSLGGDDSQSSHNLKQNSDNLPPSKRFRTTDVPDSRHSESPPPVNRDVGAENIEVKPSLSDSLMSHTPSDGCHSTPNSNAVLKGTSEPSSQMHSSNEDSDSYDDEASDAEGTDNGRTSVTDLAQPKLEPPEYSLSDRSRSDALMSPALFDPQRQRSGYAMPFNLQDIAGLIPSLSGMHNNSQDSYGSGGGSSGVGASTSASASSSTSASISAHTCGGGGGGGSTTSYVGMVEPKPFCKECGRGYSTISNLKQHVANIHSPTPQWVPCSICGKHFKTRQYLFNHLLQTHGIRQRSNRMHMAQFAQPCPPTQLGGPAAAPASASVSATVMAPNQSSVVAQPSSLETLMLSSRCHPSAPSSMAPPSQMTSPHSIGGPPPMPMNRHMSHPAATSSTQPKDRDLNGAVEQCLQYLSSTSK